MLNLSTLTADSDTSFVGNRRIKLRLASIAMIAGMGAINSYAAAAPLSLKDGDTREPAREHWRPDLHRLNDERLRNVSQVLAEEELLKQFEYLQRKFPMMFATDSGLRITLPVESNFIAVINADGSVTLTTTGSIEQVSLKNIQPNGKTGNTSGPSFGSIELNHIVFKHTTVTIAAH